MGVGGGKRRQSDTESSEWGIKINLGVTIAAMIAAPNFHLKANASQSGEPGRALSVLINTSPPF